MGASNGGHVLRSLDCGLTWSRPNEEVPPILIEGESPNDGPVHFAEDPKAGYLSRGFVSRMNWDNRLVSAIYPVFWSGNKWTYQHANSPEELRPVIGSWNIENLRKIATADQTPVDNFYSPSVLANSTDSVKLYFGGWRGAYSRGPIPQCPSVLNPTIPIPTSIINLKCVTVLTIQFQS